MYFFFFLLQEGCTPLIVAVAENNREMVEFLLQQKASVHATDKLGRYSLSHVADNPSRILGLFLSVHAPEYNG